MRPFDNNNTQNWDWGRSGGESVDQYMMYMTSRTLQVVVTLGSGTPSGENRDDRQKESLRVMICSMVCWDWV